jgi:hypothetical protein
LEVFEEVKLIKFWTRRVSDCSAPEAASRTGEANPLSSMDKDCSGKRGGGEVNAISFRRAAERPKIINSATLDTIRPLGSGVNCQLSIVARAKIKFLRTGEAIILIFVQNVTIC